MVSRHHARCPQRAACAAHVHHAPQGQQACVGHKASASDPMVLLLELDTSTSTAQIWMLHAPALNWDAEHSAPCPPACAPLHRRGRSPGKLNGGCCAQPLASHTAKPNQRSSEPGRARPAAEPPPEEQAKTTAPAALAAGAVAACCAWGQGSIAPARARPGPTTQFEQWEIAQRFLSQPGYALQEKRPSPSTQPAQC